MILFVHGWGYDARVWSEVGGLLDGIPSAALDFGYFGALRDNIPAEATLLVGHSLGFLWLLRQAKLAHLPLVGINAFPRFTASPDFAPGVAPRVLERMRRQFATEPATVLGDFWRRAGAAGPDLPPHVERLAAGLGGLADWDERATLAVHSGPVHVIAGGEDAIVPPAMTRAAFPMQVVSWLPQGGHALPQQYPAEIASLISEMWQGAVR